MRSVETSGKSIEDAKQKAARELGVPEYDIEFEVLDVGSKGILGFLGGSPAKVRATYYETRKHRLESPAAAGRMSPQMEQEPEEDNRRPQPRGRRSGKPRSQEGSNQQHRKPQRQSSGRQQKTDQPARQSGKDQSKQQTPARPGGKRGSRPRQPQKQDKQPVQAAGRTQKNSGNGQEAMPKIQEEPQNMEARANETAEIVRNILNAGNLRADVSVTEVVEDGFEISIEGEHASLLTGVQGQTLDAFQFLVGVLSNRNRERKVRVTLDAGGYRRKHRETLEKAALELAEQVIEHNQEAELEPLPARDRLIIHTVLKDHPKVYTYSEGEGENRHVVISPKAEETSG